MFLDRRMESDRGPTPLDLQHDVMRFDGRFASRLTSAYRPLVESSDPAVRLRAQRDEIGFLASALDIAVGSSPQVDLVDMMTLMALGRDAVEARWSVDVYGDTGRKILEAFETSLADVSTLVKNAFSDGFEEEVRQVIKSWQRENRNVEDVIAVRLSSYAERSDTSATVREAKGLFSVVRGATHSADAAVLLGERALYTAQRLPFHLRMHARIAVQEVIQDVLVHLAGPLRRVARRTRKHA